MFLNDLDTLFNSLFKEIDDIEKKFIHQHLIKTNPANALIPPGALDYEIKAYLVLCHAALEEYAEKSALNFLTEVNDLFMNGKKVYPTIALLASYYQAEFKIEDDKDLSNVSTTHSRLRSFLSEAKTKHSKEIHKSHGVGLKYLRKIYYPIAIDIPNDPILLGSLEKLQDNRGNFAHKWTIRSTISPEDAKIYVEDTLLLLVGITENIKQAVAHHYT